MLSAPSQYAQVPQQVLAPPTDSSLFPRHAELPKQISAGGCQLRTKYAVVLICGIEVLLKSEKKMQVLFFLQAVVLGGATLWCLYPGDSHSRPSQWPQSPAGRSTRGWTLGPGSCSSCGRRGPGPGTASHSPETLSISDRGRQSLSGTLCRCSTPTPWSPQSRKEALQRERRRVDQSWGRWKSEMCELREH